MPCNHEEVGLTSRAAYCMECGTQVPAEPMPLYYPMMEDARRLNWIKLAEHKLAIPLGKVFIGALFDTDHKVWRMGRVEWCDDCQQFEAVQEGLTIHQRCHEAAPVTHIAPDLLGVPYEPSMSAHLRSVGG